MKGPPDDFRKLNVVPRIGDVHINLAPFLRPNIVKGIYPDCDTYLDIQFRLLREDFFHQLRHGIHSYMKHVGQNVSPVEFDEFHLYRNVKIIEQSRDNIFILKFSTVGMENVQWEESKRLIHGSLLCLSDDNFQSILFFVVTDCDPELLTDGLVCARCEGGQLPSRYDKITFAMAESRAYFGAYRHVLEELQRLRLSDLQFKFYVLGRKNCPGEPSYLLQLDAPIYNIKSISRDALYSESYVWIRDLADRLTPEDIPGLNTSQCEALHAALTQEVALIQGPPGTGKTFLVSKIVQVLLDNKAYWRKRYSVPILVISYTNSALDQFLEKMLIFNQNIVRVGGQSKSEMLKPYLLSEIKERAEAMGQSIGYTDICRKADIIGMTTSGAARKKELLQVLQPKIVIVEEAALAPEAHIVVALPSSCQHLIMMGDHQQLKPPVSSNHLSKEPYNLNVSFFERLINNGMKPSVLSIQYRMRPEISRLITPAIYPELFDHESVKQYPSVKGMKKNVFFLMHNNKEEIYIDGRSRLNPYEVEMALGLARYLIQQGYAAKQITILATYLGQKITLLQSSKELFNDELTITTVDNFQGKENDIIILCLVRCNEYQSIGFLKNENRVCVALSRAKHGFYMIGDMNALQKNSSLWKEIHATLKSRKCVDQAFPLKCQVHGAITKVKKPRNFPKHGGCREMCRTQLSCGHICQSNCHVIDSNHSDYKCQYKCTRLCERGHRCKNKCYEECGPCLVKVVKTLPCGHTLMMECFKEPSGEDCKEPCTRQCPLGHPCPSLCWKPCPPCLTTVQKQLPCNHTRSMDCFSDPSKETCMVKVKKQLPCGHSQEIECCAEPLRDLCDRPCPLSCSSGHPCPGKCNEICPPCTADTTKTLRCGHSQTMECSKNHRKVSCQQPCTRRCPNDHPCPLKCIHEKCRPCQIKVTKILPCGHSKELTCRKDVSNEKCYEKCLRTCTRDHPCSGKCHEECPPCHVKIEKTLPCGHKKLMKCYLSECGCLSALRR